MKREPFSYTPLLLPVRVNPPRRNRKSAKQRVKRKLSLIQQPLPFSIGTTVREYLLKPAKPSKQ